jgi:protein-S-isoprenylcysteine O-methyltransferase Ste14
MTRVYTPRERCIAIAYGLLCHCAFAIGIGAMIAGIFSGMRLGRGPFTGINAVGWDLLLVAQFVVLHSFLLTPRGRAVLVRLAPGSLGTPLSTTTFALISSLQLLLTFGAWSQLGEIWWEPHGWLRIPIVTAYAASWVFLLKTMSDAGMAVQTGFLGWSAVARGCEPTFGGFQEHGTFRFIRQPVYLAFACTLWTGPVWTPDHMLLAVTWTAYCVLGPLLKERRYMRFYGEEFSSYQKRVPYWLPLPGRPRPPRVGTC